MRFIFFIIQSICLTLTRGSSDDAGLNKTHAILDPCRVLCKASGLDGCAGSRTVAGQCEGLYRDEAGSIVRSTEPKPEWIGISVEEARSILSTQAESCADICDQVDDCTASYCKQNNHCHGLFWSDVGKREACFYTVEKPCKTKVPVLCAHEKNTSTTTTESPTVSKDDISGNETETKDSEYLDTQELLPSAEFSGQIGDDHGVIQETSDITKVDTSPQDDVKLKTTYRAITDNSSSSRGVSGSAADAPVKANQNETQSSKSLGVSGYSYINICVIIITTIFMSLR